MRTHLLSVFCIMSLLSNTFSHAVIHTKKKEFAEPKPGLALVYIIRTGAMAGSGRNMLVFSDDEFLVALKNNSYAYADVQPGTRFWWSEWCLMHNWNFVQGLFFFEAGKTYYVESSADSMVESSTGMRLLDDSRGVELLDKVKYFSKATEKEVARAKEILINRHHLLISPLLGFHRSRQALSHEDAAYLLTQEGKKEDAISELKLARQSYQESVRQYTMSVNKIKNRKRLGVLLMALAVVGTAWAETHGALRGYGSERYSSLETGELFSPTIERIRVLLEYSLTNPDRKEACLQSALALEKIIADNSSRLNCLSLLPTGGDLTSCWPDEPVIRENRDSDGGSQ